MFDDAQTSRFTCLKNESEAVSKHAVASRVNAQLCFFESTSMIAFASTPVPAFSELQFTSSMTGSSGGMLQPGIGQSTEIPVGRHQASTPLARVPPDPGLDIQPEDWDALYLAVQERLAVCVSKCCSGLTDAVALQGAAQVQAVVAECLQALDQLRAALAVERHRSHAVEPGAQASPTQSP